MQFFIKLALTVIVYLNYYLFLVLRVELQYNFA